MISCVLNEIMIDILMICVSYKVKIIGNMYCLGISFFCVHKTIFGTGEEYQYIFIL